MIRFNSIASGSSGNCYVIQYEDIAILIDAGISTKRIIEGLARLRIKRESVVAAFITHEHIDHIYGFRVLKKRLPHLKLYGGKATLDSLDHSLKRDAQTIELEERTDFGALSVTPFKTSHDSACAYGYKIDKGDEKSIIIMTDTGYVTPQALRQAMDADVLVMESNHCEDMLNRGRYPYHLKQRILSDKGHLSNASCADTLSYILRTNNKRRLIFLAHLSKDNNTKELAFATTYNALTKEGFEHGKDFYLVVCDRDQQGAVYEL